LFIVAPLFVSRLSYGRNGEDNPARLLVTGFANSGGKVCHKLERNLVCAEAGRRRTKMAIDERSEDNFPPEIDALLEARASEEKEYLDENEEEVREIIETEETVVTNAGMSIVKTHVELVFRAEEELATGDADDPPLSEKSA
jgi:hypothetical protein